VPEHRRVVTFDLLVKCVADIVITSPLVNWLEGQSLARNAVQKDRKPPIAVAGLNIDRRPDGQRRGGGTEEGAAG
jgi:hypothetical protein